MIRLYFVGKTADEIKRAPFIHTNKEDAQEDLDALPKDAKGYRIFEVTVKEVV